jgi:hypothetical protein
MGLWIVGIGVFVLALSSCRESSHGQDVEARLLWTLGVAKLPPSCEIGRWTIDSWDEGPTYQIEMKMQPDEFRKLVANRRAIHTVFSELKSPYEQKIDLDEPFLARGEYRWQVEELGDCRLFYADVPGRYFLVYTHRPPSEP